MHVCHGFEEWSLYHILYITCKWTNECCVMCSKVSWKIWCESTLHINACLRHVWRLPSPALTKVVLQWVSAFDDIIGHVSSLSLVVEEVLSEYRERFISDVDVNMVVMELLNKSIISDSVQKSIAKADGPRQRSEILHAYLKGTCTKEAFRKVCSIIASVRGNPKMSALGEDMKRRLETGNGGCVGAYNWVC